MTNTQPTGEAFRFDGDEIPIRRTDTIAAALMRAGRLTMRTSRSGEPRGLYCAIGVCNDCLVDLDGVPNVRACITPARPDSTVVGPRSLR
jgi:hypothetical protein